MSATRACRTALDASSSQRSAARPACLYEPNP